MEIWIDRQNSQFLHEPQNKKEYLFLCLPLHSAHPKEVWKGMIHGLLNKYWRHCCRTKDCIADVRQPYKSLINRCHCPVDLRLLFKDVSEKLEKKHALEESIGNKIVS